MKKGEIYEGQVARTQFPNKGIIYIEDQEVMVKNGLAGQTVRFSISKKRKGRIEGRLLEVLAPAPEECTPACAHFGVCGGCSYQNLPYESQLVLKRTQVEDLFHKEGFFVDFEAVCESPDRERYRNKMEFTFGDEYKGGPLALGMHRKNSFYDIVTLHDCRICPPDMNVIREHVLAWFQKEKKTFYHRLRHEGFLRHLVLRRSAKTGDVLVNLVTSSQDTMDEEGFVRMLTTLSLDGNVAGILHTINDSVADVVRSDETRLLYGTDYIYEYLGDLRFKISPYSFFQTNTLGAEVLYDKVKEYVGQTRDKRIYDLYSGTGTIAQILAPVAAQVTGVEIVAEAVEAARENAAANHLKNCRFLAGDVFEVLDQLPESPDILVLDPPRDGIHPKALKKIIGYNVDEIVYVSCKPTSLVRDLKTFREAGYEVRRASLVDMFPGTANIETVVLLGKRKPDSYVKLSLGMEDYYRIKDGGKPAH